MRVEQLKRTACTKDSGEAEDGRHLQWTILQKRRRVEGNPGTYYTLGNWTEWKYLGNIVHWLTVAYGMQKGTSGENFLDYIDSVKTERA